MNTDVRHNDSCDRKARHSSTSRIAVGMAMLAAAPLAVAALAGPAGATTYEATTSTRNRDAVARAGPSTTDVDAQFGASIMAWTRAGGDLRDTVLGSFPTALGPPAIATDVQLGANVMAWIRAGGNVRDVVLGSFPTAAA